MVTSCFVGLFGFFGVVAGGVVVCMTFTSDTFDAGKRVVIGRNAVVGIVSRVGLFVDGNLGAFCNVLAVEDADGIGVVCGLASKSMERSAPVIGSMWGCGADAGTPCEADGEAIGGFSVTLIGTLVAVVCCVIGFKVVVVWAIISTECCDGRVAVEIDDVLAG